MKSNIKPIFCASPAEAVLEYLQARDETIDETCKNVGLVRAKSALTGQKLWAVVGEGEGVNCDISTIAAAEGWFEDEWESQEEV